MTVYLPHLANTPDAPRAQSDIERAQQFAALWCGADWQERAECVPDDRLTAAAQYAANDYASRNYAGHIDSLGRNANARVRAYGYDSEVESRLCSVGEARA